jgi:ferredoxin
VDCFYEGLNTLVIHPDECIDCGVCEPECPADAIRPDTEPDMEKWVTFNRKYSIMWPVIVTKKDQMPDAEARDGETGKLEKYFSENPGAGGCRWPDPARTEGRPHHGARTWRRDARRRQHHTGRS